MLESCSARLVCEHLGEPPITILMLHLHAV